MLIQLSHRSVPENLRGPILVDEHGRPRYWAVVWSAVAATSLADSTHLQKLRYIENLYQHADQLFGQKSVLDDALGSLSDNALASILESWFVSILNQAHTTESDENRWQTGLEFISSVVKWTSKSKSEQIMRRIDGCMQALTLLYRPFHVNRAKPIESIRSLPATVVEALYETLDPQSEAAMDCEILKLRNQLAPKFPINLN